MSATLVPVTLEHAAALTKEEVDALPPGQGHWWLRKDRDFIRLPKRVRGDEPLKAVIHLEPGLYIFGVGPARGGVRQSLEVVAPAATEEVAKPAKAAKLAKGSQVPLEVRGKSFVITGDLAELDRDAAKAWLTNLGAKVSTSVSGKTDYLLVGRDPGPKKLERAAELGTTVVTEDELRGLLGLAAVAPSLGAGQPAAPTMAVARTSAPPTGSPVSKVAKLMASFDNYTKMAPTELKRIEKLVGPSHFQDLGIVDDELWGISIGPQGGQYMVHIDLNDRPNYGMRCNCRTRNPCQHAHALLLTAHRHFVPPAPSPEGHREASRFVATWE